MQLQLPVTIRRSVIGLVGILFLGAAVEALIIIGLVSLYRQGIDQSTLGFIYLVAVVVLGVTLIAAIVYDSSSIVMTTEGITFTNYLRPWQESNNYTQWNQVQDVKVTEPSLLGLLAGAGTLKVNSAGEQDTDVDFSLTWVPNADGYRNFIEQQMAAANPNG